MVETNYEPDVHDCFVSVLPFQSSIPVLNALPVSRSATADATKTADVGNTAAFPCISPCGPALRRKPSGNPPAYRTCWRNQSPSRTTRSCPNSYRPGWTTAVGTCPPKRVSCHHSAATRRQGLFTRNVNVTVKVTMCCLNGNSLFTPNHRHRAGQSLTVTRTLIPDPFCSALLT